MIALFGGVLLLHLLATPLAAQPVATPPVQAQPASTVQANGIDEAALMALAADAQAEPAARRDAVARLMDHGSQPATAWVLTQLAATDADATVRRTVVQGLRSCRTPPAQVVEPLLKAVGELESSLLDDVADIIGRAMEKGHFELIARHASEQDALANVRTVAAAALGYQRTQAAAQVLVKLTDDQTPSVRAAAYAALSRLSGNDDAGTDRARWQAWWAQAGAMSPDQWQAHLLANFARRSEALTRQRGVLQDRLITALRQRYRALARDEREAVLIAMLSDPLDAVRSLSLELVREIVNTEQVGPALTAALVTRLNDTTPAIRAGATLLLRDLKNDEAADILARRLAEETERDPVVLRAYLLMMKRQPRLAAIGPAIGLLEDPRVRSEAAGAILAGFDHKPPLVGKEQSQRVAVFLRTQLAMEATPEPRFVELLGRVGNDADYRQIRRWLDHEVDAVKEAAARTWAASDRTLWPLAERSGDPVIQAIVIPAATQRGMNTETLLALIDHRPKSEQFAVAWGRALIAMAPRVDPEALVIGDQRLMKHEDLTDLRLQILSAGIERILQSQASSDVAELTGFERQIHSLQLMDLLLARAEVRLVSGDWRAALADLDRVMKVKVDLVISQQHRFDLIAIHARILGGELDEAFLRAGRYITVDPAARPDQVMRGRVIDLLLHCANHCVTTKKPERAGQIVSRLRARLPKPVPMDVETRMLAVEGLIKATPATP